MNRMSRRKSVTGNEQMNNGENYKVGITIMSRDVLKQEKFETTNEIRDM